MKTYITEKIISGNYYESPQIRAHSWDQASKKARKIGVTLIGELKVVWIGY